MNRADSPNNPNAFLEQVRTVIRLKHLSLRTEDSYLSTIRRFIVFHGKRHPASLGPDAIRDYLTHLAVEEHVAASTQNVARNALLFLYREVLGVPLPPLTGVAPARRPERLPVVFTRAEVKAILNALGGTPHLLASLLYGSGLRLMECLRLRVKDIDLEMHQITVRDGKGQKDRLTMLPRTLETALREHLAVAHTLYQQDLAAGCANVFLPDALARKYSHAPREWAWQWVFPAKSLSADPRSGLVRRHHLGEETLQRAVKAAIAQAAIPKAGSCHTLRHSFATHLIEDGYDITPIKPSNCPRVIGPQGRPHHHDLYPRPGPGRARRRQPARYPVTSPRERTGRETGRKLGAGRETGRDESHPYKIVPQCRRHFHRE